MALDVPSLQLHLRLDLTTSTGSTPMNSGGDVDIKRAIAGHLGTEDLTSLAHTNRAHFHLFHDEAQRRLEALRLGRDMGAFLVMRSSGRQAAADTFVNALHCLEHTPDETRLSSAMLTLAGSFYLIPASPDRGQLAVRFVARWPALPVGADLAQMLCLFRLSWLPATARAEAAETILFPIMDRLIDAGWMPNTMGHSGVRSIWAQLKTLPVDAQAEAKNRIDTMADALQARGTPLPGLPWVDRVDPSLSVHAR